MDMEKIIYMLNQALEREMEAVSRYLHQSFLVMGPHRQLFVDVFRAQSREAMDHAIRLGEKIVALGGDPVVKILEIYEPKKQTIHEMLEADLEYEKKELKGYKKILKMVEEDVALSAMIQQHIFEETHHVEGIEKMLRKQI